MIDVGAVGSPVDVATLVVAVVTLVRVMSSQADGHAVTAAIAQEVDGVDADRVRADLEVEAREISQYLHGEES